MLPLDKIRSSPNRGRYLFHNAALRLVVGSIDLTLGLLRSPSRSSLVIDPRKILVCNQAHIGDVIWASVCYLFSMPPFRAKIVFSPIRCPLLF
jgi:hypothetical protein